MIAVASWLSPEKSCTQDPWWLAPTNHQEDPLISLKFNLNPFFLIKAFPSSELYSPLNDLQKS